MEIALKNTIIAKTYNLTLKSFLKMNLNMEMTAIKYHSVTFYIQKNKFLIIFEQIAVLFAKNSKNAAVINLSTLSN